MSQPANDDFSQHLSDDEASYHEASTDNGRRSMIMGHGDGALPLNLLTIEMFEGKFRIEILRKGESQLEKEGVVRILPQYLQCEIHVVEKAMKGNNHLTNLPIPKEHLRRFHGMDDAKEIWEAIRTRFGGNANLKKM
ncbi:hypothetical protein Tco_0587547 [Tanacetum coccineum]